MDNELIANDANLSALLRTKDTIFKSPRQYADCCLSLSTTLFETLSSFLPSIPHNTLSIGSGSGLLEALIHDVYPLKSIYGVEVSRAVNKHLSEEFMHIVPGTHSLCAAAKGAAVWLFVYPRETRLIKRYLDGFTGGELRRIIWLGPVSDWIDYIAIFPEEQWDIRMQRDCGLMPYETMAVMERKDTCEKMRMDENTEDELNIEYI